MLAADGTIKLVDLGSVRVAALDEIVTPLDPNHLVGTLDYAAPEFYENQPGSERSDLYALGTIVYEILTGALPYRAHRPTQTDDRHAHYTSALHDNPMVPVWIDGALQKSVACNPEERYEALSEFVYDLTHPNPKFVYRVPRPLIERDPVAFWRGVAGVLIVIDIVALYWLLA
jgi:serine/threonine protein kinase